MSSTTADLKGHGQRAYMGKRFRERKQANATYPVLNDAPDPYRGITSNGGTFSRTGDCWHHCGNGMRRGTAGAGET